MLDAAGGFAVGSVRLGTVFVTRNQPSPWTVTSSALPVDWKPPAPIMLSIEPRRTPRPTWAGFDPPEPAVAAAPARTVCERASLNVARAPL